MRIAHIYNQNELNDTIILTLRFLFFSLQTMSYFCLQSGKVFDANDEEELIQNIIDFVQPEKFDHTWTMIWFHLAELSVIVSIGAIVLGFQWITGLSMVTMAFEISMMLASGSRDDHAMYPSQIRCSITTNSIENGSMDVRNTICLLPMNSIHQITFVGISLWLCILLVGWAITAFYRLLTAFSFPLRIFLLKKCTMQKDLRANLVKVGVVIPYYSSHFLLACISSKITFNQFKIVVMKLCEILIVKPTANVTP